MEKILYMLFICTLSGCSGSNNRYAEVRVKSDNVQFVKVADGIDGTYFWGIGADTIFANHQNEFVFKKRISTPEIVAVIVGDKSVNSILFPGSRIDIIDTDSVLSFTGENKKGWDFFNKLAYCSFPIHVAEKYSSDSTRSQLSQRIELLKGEDLKTLKKLRSDHQIDEQLYEALKMETDYFYALRTVQAILEKQYERIPVDQDLLKFLEETYEKYPLESEYKPRSWLYYANCIALLKPFHDLRADKLVTIDSILTWKKEDKLIPFKYHLINDFPNQKIAERAAAYFIWHHSIQLNFEKSLISVFTHFKETYPESPFIEVLDPKINFIENYHEKISGEMPDEMRFLEGKSFATVQELIPELKGQKYYVDVWASWCGPCKVEFKHNEGLNALLKANGYKKLFISFDRKDRERKWKEMIKYYDLEGLHMLASTDFFKDFEKNYSKHNRGVSIPQYLIIDEKGDILTNDAPRPSNLTELKKVL